MRKPITVSLLLVTSLLLFCCARVSQAQSLFDDFNVKPINPTKWAGSERDFGPEAPNEEATRKIANGKLEIDLTSYGRMDSDSGSAGTANSKLEGIGVTGPYFWGADVTVKSVKAVGCAANATSTRSGARILGEFFNDGTSSGPGDRTGDIFAGIESRRDTITGNHIVGFVGRCTNAGCTTTTTLVFHEFTTVWTKGAAHTLLIQWVPLADFFLLQVDLQEDFMASYTVSDTDAPVHFSRQVGAANSVANCQSGPRASATIKALFDNVKVFP